MSVCRAGLTLTLSQVLRVLSILLGSLLEILLGIGWSLVYDHEQREKD